MTALPIEDFEDLADAAPDHVRLEYIDGRARTKDPLSVEDFEELERRAPETVRLEYINGKLEVKAMPDGNHREIFVWLQEQCMQHRPDLRVYGESGVRTEAYQKGRARTDGAVALKGHFKGHGEWSQPRDGRYQQKAAHSWGSPVELPEPLRFTLDTEELKDYADWGQWSHEPRPADRPRPRPPSPR
ncbi:Uma2 family endonuclease [Streptomyces collinus]